MHLPLDAALQRQVSICVVRSVRLFVALSSVEVIAAIDVKQANPIVSDANASPATVTAVA